MKKRMNFTAFLTQIDEGSLIILLFSLLHLAVYQIAGSHRSHVLRISSLTKLSRTQSLACFFSGLDRFQFHLTIFHRL